MTPLAHQNGRIVLAFIASVFIPVALAVAVLVFSERSAVHSDELIREVARHGLTGEMIDAEKLLGTKPANVLPPPQPPMLHIKKRESEDAPKSMGGDDSDDSGDTDERR